MLDRILIYGKLWEKIPSLHSYAENIQFSHYNRTCENHVQEIVAVSQQFGKDFPTHENNKRI